MSCIQSRKMLNKHTCVYIHTWARLKMSNAGREVCLRGLFRGMFRGSVLGCVSHLSPQVEKQQFGGLPRQSRTSQPCLKFVTRKKSHCYSKICMHYDQIKHENWQRTTLKQTPHISAPALLGCHGIIGTLPRRHHRPARELVLATWGPQGQWLSHEHT